MNNRLPPRPEEWIDRGKEISFEFEGQKYVGYRGDVLTSALWANGVRLMGRSFKYHRPRSLYSLAGHDANVIVETDEETNLRGDLLPLESGLRVRAVNTWGGLRRDRYRFTELFSRFLPVGFYYKAFYTPRRLFPYYERRMRQMAGLGRIHPKMRTPASPKDYDFCELLVVGAGPSGLAAAIAAAEAGVDVLVVDEQPRAGGSLCWQMEEGAKVRIELLDRVAALPNLRLRLETQVAGWYADQWAALVDRTRLTKLRAQATLVAAGAIEQPPVFQNNDAPGVMLGSAARRLINQYAIKPFERAVVMTANEDGYRTVVDLAHANVSIVGVVDLRPQGETSPLAQEVAGLGIEVLTGHAVCEAASGSDGSLRAVAIYPLDINGTPRSTATRHLRCDGLAVSVGWAPNSNLLSQAGGKFRYAAEIEQLVPADLPPGVFAAGRVNGHFPIARRLEDGRRAGLAAAAYLGRSVEIPAGSVAPSAPQSHPYPVFAHKGKKNFVDFDEDLHLVDFVNAHQEGYDNIELMKRYSTVGMGPSQGKISSMNAVRILARLNNRTIDQTGTTTGRPFFQPVSIGLLAGRRFHPHRSTPLDAWHRSRGAVMIQAGAWFRPEYYPTGDRSREDCVFDEAQRVRRDVGVIDLGTLTKILVYGGDAARFLERVYTGKFAGQKPGTTRYAVAVDESGVVAEDGLVARLADNRFYLTASTVGGEAFYREMQRLAIVWGMNVTLVNATGHWGAINVAGPHARQLLACLTDISLEPATFPANGVREGRVADADAVVMRSGFTGELSYELHIAASNTLRVWESLLASGSGREVRPFGTEAQRLLRLEKGHLILGHDTDALTNPFEVRLERVVDMSKPFFVGKRTLEILRRAPRERALAGIAFREGESSVPEECQLVIDQGEIVGRVTSIARRSTVGRPIGMAFVHPRLSAPGTKLKVKLWANRFAEAEVVALPFYDPDNLRQRS